MNPALIILVLLGAAVLWLFLSFLFKPLGRLICRIFKNVNETVNDEDSGTDGKKEE